MKFDDFITLSVYYSRLKESPFKFWKIFQSRAKEIYNGKIENYSKLHNALLNLKLNSPEIYNKIIGTFNLNMLEKAENEWKKYRKSEVKKDYKTNIQKMAEEVLDEIKMEYVAEYYDEYNIDLAIVEKKVAFELCGPSHYIWPSMKLNGKSAQKVNNLQKKGWKVCLIKFAYGPREVVCEEVRKNILSFLNEQDADSKN
jgi:very-short-patch-repair endonuclease